MQGNSLSRGSVPEWGPPAAQAGVQRGNHRLTPADLSPTFARPFSGAADPREPVFYANHNLPRVALNISENHIPTRGMLQ